MNKKLQDKPNSRTEDWDPSSEPGSWVGQTADMPAPPPHPSPASCRRQCACPTQVPSDPFHRVDAAFSWLQWAFFSQQPTAATLIWRVALGLRESLCQNKPETVGHFQPHRGCGPQPIMMGRTEESPVPLPSAPTDKLAT